MQAVSTALLVGIAMSGAMPHPTRASETHAAAAIAHVRYIQRGLTVQAPHAHPGKGKLKQSLFTRYALQTRSRQKASIDFQDGTLLHLNQLTSAILRSTAVTQVKSGEVEEQVVPGTNHQVQTAAANASAVGTIFDVLVKGKVTIITVVEGAVLVQTAQGSILVKSGQQVSITRGKAPSQPAPVDIHTATAWSASIPPPSAPLGTNIALDANGGEVYHWTSQRDDPQHTFDARNANDGSANRGWQSAAGQITDQSLWVRFQGLRSYTITGVLLDCAATGGQDQSNAARDFEVLASDDPFATTSGFTAVYHGTCAQQPGVQVFPFSGGAADMRAGSSGVKATALQIHFLNNHGGKDGIAVAEIGVVGQEAPDVLGTPTPEPTDMPTATATATPTVVTAASLSGPASVDFGRWLYNQTSPPQMVTITNNGQVPTAIQRLNLREEFQSIFNIVADTCTGATLQPGAICTVSLTFDPFDLTGNTGSLLVTYSGSSTPLAIPLSGQAYFLLMSVPTLQASWTDYFDQSMHLLSTSNSQICASFTRMGYTFTLNDSNQYGQHNAVSSGSNVPLSEPVPASGVEYDNMDHSLIWKAQAYIQVVGVGTGNVQVQYTAQITGQGSTFQILTPVVTPNVSQVDQCPATLQPASRYRERRGSVALERDRDPGARSQPR